MIIKVLIILVVIYTYALPSYQAQVCATQVNSLQTGLFWVSRVVLSVLQRSCDTIFPGVNVTQATHMSTTSCICFQVHVYLQGPKWCALLHQDNSTSYRQKPWRSLKFNLPKQERLLMPAAECSRCRAGARTKSQPASALPAAGLHPSSTAADTRDHL